MEDFIKKNNIPGLKPAKVDQVQKTTPIVKEAIGNFFETLSKNNTETVDKETLDLQIASIKRQSRDLQALLSFGANGKNLNVVG